MLATWRISFEFLKVVQFYLHGSWFQCFDVSCCLRYCSSDVAQLFLDFFKGGWFWLLIKSCGVPGGCRALLLVQGASGTD